MQYDRVQASQGPGAMGPQWCTDASGTRWSCRRAKAETILTGLSVLPPTGTCGDAALQNGCAPPALVACTFYDRTLPLPQNPVTQMLSSHDCWARMDYHLALVQDTVEPQLPRRRLHGRRRRRTTPTPGPRLASRRPRVPAAAAVAS